MRTTTMRVDVETHAALVELADASGATLQDTVREASEALRRQRFAGQVRHELAQLRADPVAWADYLAEAGSTEVTDGVGH